MLAPVSLAYSKVEDREPWKKRPPLRKPKKKKKDPAPSTVEKTGDHIDITA